MKKLLLSFLLAAIAASLFAPLSANAAEYDAFVGCDGLAENPVPSHVCQVGDVPGAFFESDTEVEVELCVEFPTGTVLCSEEELAEAEILYVFLIFSELEGDYSASWFVGEEEVGSWAFRLEAPPPPPSPPAPPPPAPAPPPPSVAPVTSPECLQAQHQVSKLKKQLRNASGRKQKVKVRGKLKSTRARARRLC